MRNTFEETKIEIAFWGTGQNYNESRVDTCILPAQQL